MEQPILFNPYEAIMAEIRQLRSEMSVVMEQLTHRVHNETLDTDQAAQFLGVHKNTIMNMLHRGEIRAQRSGRKYLFTREQLYKFLNESNLTGSRPGY